MGDFEAASTAAEGRFNSKRQAVFFRELDDLLGIIDWISGARDEWRTNFWAMWRACTLSPRTRMACGGGPIHRNPASMTAWAKSAFSERNP